MGLVSRPSSFAGFRPILAFRDLGLTRLDNSLPDQPGQLLGPLSVPKLLVEGDIFFVVGLSIRVDVLEGRVNVLVKIPALRQPTVPGGVTLILQIPVFSRFVDNLLLQTASPACWVLGLAIELGFGKETTAEHELAIETPPEFPIIGVVHEYRPGSLVFAGPDLLKDEVVLLIFFDAVEDLFRETAAEFSKPYRECTARVHEPGVLSFSLGQDPV